VSKRENCKKSSKQCACVRMGGQGVKAEGKRKRGRTGGPITVSVTATIHTSTNTRKTVQRKAESHLPTLQLYIYRRALCFRPLIIIFSLLHPCSLLFLTLLTIAAVIAMTSSSAQPASATALFTLSVSAQNASNPSHSNSATLPFTSSVQR